MQRSDPPDRRLGAIRIVTIGIDADTPTDERFVILVDVRPERRGPMLSVIQVAIGGATVTGVANASEALAAAERVCADAAVVEVQLPVADGLATIAALRAAHPSMTIVVCSFQHDPATKRQAEDAGADAYLAKPVSARELRGALNAARRVPLEEIAVH